MSRVTKGLIYLHFCIYSVIISYGDNFKRAVNGVNFIFSFLGITVLFILNILIVDRESDLVNPYLIFGIIFFLPIIISIKINKVHLIAHRALIERFLVFKKNKELRIKGMWKFKLIGTSFLMSPVIFFLIFFFISI